MNANSGGRRVGFHGSLFSKRFNQPYSTVEPRKRRILTCLPFTSSDFAFRPVARSSVILNS